MGEVRENYDEHLRLEAERTKNSKAASSVVNPGVDLSALRALEEEEELAGDEDTLDFREKMKMKKKKEDGEKSSIAPATYSTPKLVPESVDDAAPKMSKFKAERMAKKQ